MTPRLIREILSLALEQSEARLDDDPSAWTPGEHNDIVREMTRLDALISAAEAVVADMVQDDVPPDCWDDYVGAYITPEGLGMYGLDRASDVAAVVHLLPRPVPHVHYFRPDIADVWCETEGTTTDQCSEAISRPAGNY